MSSSTPNLGLVKLAGTDNFSNANALSGNWDKVDEFAGSFGQFTYVYKGGLGHVTGETRLDKFVRAYNADAFPIGKPFFGYISAGSQLLVMGYLYMSSNQLYGSGWISSYDGCTQIRVTADQWYDETGVAPVIAVTYNNGSYGTADFFIRADGRNVTFNGYFAFTNAPTGEVTIGNIANYRPSASVRVPCALADAAWSVPSSMAYFTISNSGNVIVNAPSNNTKKVIYVSCSWTYQGTL